MEEYTNISSIKDLCELFAERIGPCPRCGAVPAVIAVYENNDAIDPCGFKVICECDIAGRKEVSQEEMAAFKTYTLEEVIKMFRD